MLQLAPIRSEIDVVRAALDDGVRSGAAIGSVMHAGAVSLLFTEYARDNDTTALAVARRAIDLMLDSLTTSGHGEDPARLVQAALLGALAKAWVITGDARYHDAGKALARALARQLVPGQGRVIFADQEAYAIHVLVLSAATFGEASAETRARGALDALLQRMYARGWGVRHSSGAGMPGLLQDQVQVATACVAMHHITQDARYLDIARDLATILDSSYADPAGGYYDAAQPPAAAAAPDPAAPALADRTKHVLDDMLPGANAAAAQMLLRLAEATGERSYRRRAEATLEAFAGSIGGAGLRAATFLEAAREALAAR
jgi:uncharacterized protein YyaL (SSP411 family)